jgi:hypothetical protein
MSGNSKTIASRHFRILEAMASLEEECKKNKPLMKKIISNSKIIYKFTKKCLASVRYGFIHKRYRNKAHLLVGKYTNKALKNELADYFHMEHDGKNYSHSFYTFSG